MKLPVLLELLEFDPELDELETALLLELEPPVPVQVTFALNMFVDTIVPAALTRVQV